MGLCIGAWNTAKHTNLSDPYLPQKHVTPLEKNHHDRSPNSPTHYVYIEDEDSQTHSKFQ